MARFIAALTAAALLARNACAQGCALCYTQASAQGAHAEKSLNFGILILLVPSLLVFGSVLVLLVRRGGASA